MALDVSPFFTDPDGDVLTFTATGIPPGITLNPVTGVFSGTFTTEGSYTVAVTATDPGSLFVIDTFTWLISPPGNQAPTVVGAGIPDQSGTVGVPA